MDAGEWQYIGVTPGTLPGATSGTYIVEAHKRGRWHETIRLRIATMGPDQEDPAGKLRPVAVMFDAVVDGVAGFHPELAVGDLARVPYSRLLSQAGADPSRADIAPLTPTLSASDETPPDFHELRKEWPKGDTDTVARWAGRLYSRAVAAGDSATKAVEDAFGVSKSTAKRMVGLARDLGYLDANVVGAPVPQRKRKEHHDGER